MKSIIQDSNHKLTTGLWLLIFMLIVNIHLKAQWTNTIQHQYTALKSVKFIDADKGFTTGGNGTFLATINRGKTWEIRRVPTSRDLWSVFPFSENLIWVCGDSGTVFRSMDGGQTWFDKSISTTSKLWSIYFTSVDTGFAVGQPNCVYRTNDGGLNWSSISLPSTPANFYHVSFLNSNLGWISGIDNSSFGAVWRTTDGGENWTKRISLNIGAIREVQFLDENLGYLAANKIYKTTNGGISASEIWGWRTYSLKFVSPEIGWVTGPDGNTAKTTNGGTDWISQTPDFGGGRDLWSVDFVDTLNGFMCGNADYIWQTTDGGFTWKRQAVGMASLKNVFALDNNTCWVVGGEPGKVLKTINGGNRWSITSPGDLPTNQPSSLSSIFFINNTTGWVCGYNGTIFKTTTGGTDWIVQSSSSNRHLRSIFFTDQNNGWAAGSNGNFDDIVLQTTNGGESWIEIDFGTSSTFFSIYFLNTTTGWLVSDNKLYKTTNAGTDWQVIPTGTYSGFRAVHFESENVGWISGLQFLKTTDGGTTWVGSSPPSNYTYLSIYFFNEQMGWGGGFAGIHYTSDGGTTWTRQDDNNARIDAISFLDNNNGWAVGLINGEFGVNTNAILRTINGGATSINNDGVVPNDFTLYQNYPNPFNPTTTIKFAIPNVVRDLSRYNDKLFVTLKVFDILGNEVSTLINEYKSPGKYEVQFDAANLPSGIYFYQLTNGAFSVTKKLILLK
jgi:photosystem II stability/assembly factor-like uncharacterized protein